MSSSRVRRCATGLLLLTLLAPAATVRSATTAATLAQLSAADIDGLLDSADAFLLQRDFKQAQPEFQRALEAARQSAFEPQIARALLGLSDILLRTGQAAAATPGAEEALATYDRLDQRPGIARANYLLSRIALANRDRGAALAYAQRALEVFDGLQDHQGFARAALQVLELGDLADEEARALGERAASGARAGGNAVLEGEVLHDFGDHLFNAGRYEESMQMLTRAAAAYESAHALVDLGTVYNSIGRVYRAHGRLDEALKYQMAALELHRKGDSRLMLLQSLNAVGVVYQRLGDSAAAQSYIGQALSLSEQISSPAVQDFLGANMADLLVDLGQFANAAATLEQVINRGLDHFLPTRYLQLSRAYVGLGRGRDALAAAESAVAGCTGGEQDVCISAYIARSEAQALLGRSPAAIEDLSVALSRLEDLRKQLLPADFFRQDFHRYYQFAYTDTIALQVGVGQGRQALETAELARSRAFLDLLASRSLPPAPPRASTTVPLQLRGGGAETDGAPPATAQAVPATAADLVATAARLGSTLLLYWVGPDETFIWVVKADGAVHTRRVAVRRSRLTSLVRQTSPLVESAGPGEGPSSAARAPTAGASPLSLRDASSAWRELYTVLIAPISDVLPTSPGALLTIVPHDSLSRLSFAALQNSRGRYLLEDFTLHYSPAGAMFHFTAPDTLQPRPRTMLLVSDPVPPHLSALDAPLPRLPGARSEAAAITRLMSAGQITSLQDAAATEARVRDSAPSNTILHFATHALVRDDDPFASYLALGPSAMGTGAADGLLTAQEVYGLRLRADLVVLSACRSAGGIVTGDGIATFARAFLYAGTRSFVASLWDVADQPTSL
ncbi:MAG: CHAT domain-containing tetratricopeptide repeat protein, partial [Vicinamibacterales bacterium]